MKGAKPGGGRSAGRPEQQQRRGAVHKPSARGPSKLALALQQKKPVASASASAAAAGLHFFEALTNDEAAFNAELVELVRECLRCAPTACLTLSELGAAVRSLGTRRGLRCAGGEGKLQSLSKHVKAQWGSWEAFARDNAGLHFANGSLELREQPQQGSAEMETQAADAPRQQHGAVPSRAEIESISLGGM